MTNNLPDAGAATQKALAAANAAITRIAAAAERRAANLAALLRPDGQPKYGAAEDAERRAAIDAEYAAAIDGAEAVAQAGATVLTRYAVAAADPLWLLPAAEIARVDALQRLAEQDARNVPITTLAARIQAAARSGDLAVVLAYDRARPAFEQRTAAEQQRQEIAAALVELRTAAEAAHPKPPAQARDARRAVDDLWTAIGRARLDMNPIRPVAPF